MKHKANTFATLPQTRRNHFVLYLYAAIYHLINQMRHSYSEDAAAILAGMPFLKGYYDEMVPYLPEALTWGSGRRWWQEQIESWEQESPVHLPLNALSTLSFAHRLALLTIGLVEEDSRFGTIMARLQAPLNHRRPCLELLVQVLNGAEPQDRTDAWQLSRPLLDAGMVTVSNKEAPRSEWILHVPSPLWDLLRGEMVDQPAPWCQVRPMDTLVDLENLILPVAFYKQISQLETWLLQAPSRAVVLRGILGSDRVETLGGLAKRLKLNAVIIRQAESLSEEAWRLLGPFCAMSASLPILVYDLGPGETGTPPSLAGYQGPLAIVLGLEGGLRGDHIERALTLTLPLPKVALRQRLWQAALGEHAVVDLEKISERFHLPAGHIRKAAKLAIGEAILAQQPAVHMSEVRRASRALNRQLLDTLATPIEAEGSWDLLVVSDQMRQKLHELEQRCRHRERLQDRLGPAFVSGTNRGVRALFTGSSGTGKTMAARILANELGLDLYRVDLAAVVNKYIGETEKNLHQVLSTAEALDVVLLLDEGDSLLGSRTEVRSANDRYANLETNFLLQRLEHYQGIVLITSNASENIDSAFQRRIDVVVNFVMPQAEARWHIWQLHLPEAHAVSPAVLEEIAIRCTLNGGQIRNAALHAILLALEGQTVLTDHHLRQAVESEYRKAGAHLPLSDNDRPERNGSTIESFLSALP